MEMFNENLVPKSYDNVQTFPFNEQIDILNPPPQLLELQK